MILWETTAEVLLEAPGAALQGHALIHLVNIAGLDLLLDEKRRTIGIEVLTYFLQGLPLRTDHFPSELRLLR